MVLPMLAEFAARLVGVLLLPVLVLFCILADLGWAANLAIWAAWLILALASDALLPPVTAVRPQDRLGDGLEAVLLCLPVLVQAGVLALALWLVRSHPVDGWYMAALALTLGIAGGAVGISAAHELLHRRHPALRALAQVFMALVTYPHFPVVHLQVHHPFVGTALDPGTSQRGEPLPLFLPRALRLAWVGAWRAEAQRMARLHRSPWSWRSRLMRALALQGVVLLGVWLLFGVPGLVLFLAQSVAAVFLNLTIDYTQHYGVERREVAPGRLERFRAEHAWTAPQASNRSIFNLGLHADHHLVPARRYAELDNAPGSLQAPFGYPGLFLLALVPPLWFRVMNPRLAAAPQAAVSERA